MSDDLLSDYADDVVEKGVHAQTPADPETRGLAGTVQMARAALGAPAADPKVEEEAREKALAQMQAMSPPADTSPGEAAGSGGAKDAAGEKSWFDRFMGRLRG